MYTKKTYPIKGMLRWTRRYIYVFILLSLIPVFLFDVMRWKWLYVPWLPLGVLGTAVSFIVSFKNNASYDRLWEARKIWGGIVNTSRSFTVMVKDFIKNNQITPSELKTIHRELVHRHVAWLTALRYQMRKDKPWENHIKLSKSNREFREENVYVPEDNIPIKEAISPYISETEYNEVFAKGNQASQLLGIQSRRIKELHDEGFIDNFRHMELEKVIVELYTLQGKSERIKNFPYPRQFATLNFMFVWVFIILLPYGMMQEFEALGDRITETLANHQSRTAIMHKVQVFIARHFEWFSVPFSTLIAWVFYSMEAIGENSENPFEGGPNDVPITNMSRGIEIDIRQLIDDTDIPEPYKWNNDIVL
ncbi:bestrophin family protein [Tenacibaculum aiptasiae]|uniref:bestrophin family protein n=1 Tax=Tenacibaculum aiptasiae TaxID=426481 RepID=UPI00232F956A|nr:bestrophin family ion channel [Tenacibaculum aiptasiae]